MDGSRSRPCLVGQACAKRAFPVPRVTPFARESAAQRMRSLQLLQLQLLQLQLLQLQLLRLQLLRLQLLQLQLLQLQLLQLLQRTINKRSLLLLLFSRRSERNALGGSSMPRLDTARGGLMWQCQAWTCERQGYKGGSVAGAAAGET